jgi:hypothetical protein
VQQAGWAFLGVRFIDYSSTQVANDRRVVAYNRLLGAYSGVKAQAEAKEEELRLAKGTSYALSSGGAPVHPLGVAPEIRADC